MSGPPARPALRGVRLPIDTVLLVVDLQEAIDDPRWGPRNNPQAEEVIAALVAAWREAGMRIVHIRHDSVEPASPYRPGGPGHGFKACAAPRDGEAVVGKRTGSAFVDTELDDLLAAGGHTTLVVCGVLSHNSVASTVRHAGCLGYRVIVPADACWAVDVRDGEGRVWPAEAVHHIAMATLAPDYAVVVGTAQVLQAVGMAAALKAWKAARRREAATA